MTILEMENKRLFVGNLFPEVTSEDLENKFSRYHKLSNRNHSINYCHCMQKLTITIPSTSPFTSSFVQFIFIHDGDFIIPKPGLAQSPRWKSRPRRT